MTSSPVIILDGVTKRYPLKRGPGDILRRLIKGAAGDPLQAFTALDDVSLEVRKGEAVGIIGLNGAGKSSLLQIVSGIRSPSSGSVRVDGKVASLIDLGSGFSSEFTGRENVHIYGAVLGMRRDEIRAKFASISAFADIGDFIDRPVKTYSSGMLLRLAFSVATHVDASILVFDEVIAVGDSAFQFKCFRRLQDLRERGATILMVSHEIDTVTSLFPRTVILHRGRKHYDGDSAAALWEYWRLVSVPQGSATPPGPSRGSTRLDSRIGTGEVHFLDARVRDTGGATCRSYRAAGRCLVQLSFIPQVDVAHGSIGVLVQNHRALNVYGFNTAHDPLCAYSWKAGRRQDARIELTLNLAPGKYFVSASCNRVEDGRIVCLGSLDSFAEISIEGQSGVFGISDLFAKATPGRAREVRPIETVRSL